MKKIEKESSSSEEIKQEYKNSLTNDKYETFDLSKVDRKNKVEFKSFAVRKDKLCEDEKSEECDEDQSKSLPLEFVLSPILGYKENQAKIKAIIEDSEE